MENLIHNKHDLWDYNAIPEIIKEFPGVEHCTGGHFSHYRMFMVTTFGFRSYTRGSTDEAASRNTYAKKYSGFLHVLRVSFYPPCHARAGPRFVEAKAI